MNDVAVTPPLVNDTWVRSVGVLGALWIASKFPAVPIAYLRSLHFFSFAAWFGTNVWVLFLVPRIHTEAVPLHAFKKLQAKLFREYFGFSAAALVTMMVTVPFQSIPYTLLVAFFFNALNWLFFEPQISGLEAQRNALENERPRNKYEIDELKGKIEMFRGTSSIALLFAIFCGIAHGVNLSFLNS